jgi:hypothetical protein
VVVEALENGKGTTAAAPPGVDTQVGNAIVVGGNAKGIAAAATGTGMVAVIDTDEAPDVEAGAGEAENDGDAICEVADETETSVAAAVLRTRDP